MYKKLTEEQQEKFKQYYLDGDSAFIIFQKLGQPYEFSSQANTRMRQYRIELELPKRGIGWYPKANHRKTSTKNQKIREKQKLLKRIGKLENMIPIWESKVANWRKELSKLLVELMRCKLYQKCGSSDYNCNDDFDAIRFCEARMKAKIING